MGYKPRIEKEKLINKKNYILRIYVGFVKKKIYVEEIAKIWKNKCNMLRRSNTVTIVVDTL
jgi:hypothetical protein